MHINCGVFHAANAPATTAIADGRFVVASLFVRGSCWFTNCSQDMQDVAVEEDRKILNPSFMRPSETICFTLHWPLLAPPTGLLFIYINAVRPPTMAIKVVSSV